MPQQELHDSLHYKSTGPTIAVRTDMCLSDVTCMGRYLSQVIIRTHLWLSKMTRSWGQAGSREWDSRGAKAAMATLSEFLSMPVMNAASAMDACSKHVHRIDTDRHYDTVRHAVGIMRLCKTCANANYHCSQLNPEQLGLISHTTCCPAVHCVMSSEARSVTQAVHKRALLSTLAGHSCHQTCHRQTHFASPAQLTKKQLLRRT